MYKKICDSVPFERTKNKMSSTVNNAILLENVELVSKFDIKDCKKKTFAPLNAYLKNCNKLIILR